MYAVYHARLSKKSYTGVSRPALLQLFGYPRFRSPITGKYLKLTHLLTFKPFSLIGVMPF
jgi:hypothetical protein